MKLNAFPIMLVAILLFSCLSDGSFKKPFAGFKPLDLEDGWELSYPEKENMDVDKLEEAFALLYSQHRFIMARSLLVFRNGKLVAEAYPNSPEDAYKLSNIQSCTKSITSILIGIALEKNLIQNLDIKLSDVFPDLFDNNVGKRNISLRNALTMETGLNFDNGRHTSQLYRKEGSSVKWILSKDFINPPGTKMNYNDGDPHLVSKAIESLSGQSMSSFAMENLFIPLGIKDWNWESSKDEVTYGAFGLSLKPRDLAKIGQLLLQNGIWNNQKIISTEYLKEAVSKQTVSEYNNSPYGYYFWLLPEWNAFYAFGHGGQFVLVVPDKNLLIVYTAWPYSHSQLWDNEKELMEKIINSCR